MKPSKILHESVVDKGIPVHEERLTDHRIEGLGDAPLPDKKPGNVTEQVIRDRAMQDDEQAKKIGAKSRSSE